MTNGTGLGITLGKKRFLTRKFPFWAAAVLVAAMVAPTVGWTYHHRNSSIRYQEYSQSAFELARRENKPIFMVVSAVWCYWCKVYEEGTLEKVEVSSFLNRNFVNIFVDLDQRQDLRHLYASKAIPTTVIFTPKGKEYLSFAGTLGKKEFLSGLTEVLTQIKKDGRAPTAGTAPSVKNVSAFLEAPLEPMLSAAAPAQRDVSGQRSEFLALVVESHDETHEGFGLGKKYPMGALLQFLLLRYGVEKDEQLLSMATGTLNRIAAELFDPVEGGFFRYADRSNWKRPRHEKMLTTNVNLIRAFQLAAELAPKASRAKNSPDYETVYRKSLEYLLTTLYHPASGGFMGSQDGKNPSYYRLNAAQRAKVTRPRVDPTIFTAWNGEAIYLLHQVYTTVPTARLKGILTRAVGFLRARLLSKNDGFYNHYRIAETQPSGQGMLRDNAWGAVALMVGFQLTGEKAYRRDFDRVLSYMDSHLLIPASGVYRLWNIPPGDGVRAAERISDEVPLTANSVVALALVKAHAATGKAQYKKKALRLLSTFRGLEAQAFEDDPEDSGKQFFLSFVHYLNAWRHLVRADS